MVLVVSLVAYAACWLLGFLVAGYDDAPHHVMGDGVGSSARCYSLVSNQWQLPVLRTSMATACCKRLLAPLIASCCGTAVVPVIRLPHHLLLLLLPARQPGV